MTDFVEFLQAEHVKLLQNYSDLQKRYDILAAATENDEACIGDTSKLSFVQKLVAKITEIYDNDLYRF